MRDLCRRGRFTQTHILGINSRWGESNDHDGLSGTGFAHRRSEVEETVMSLVRLLGFTTLGCGCVVGRYREVATSREVTYVEEKGKGCGSHGHRRNHTIASERLAAVPSIGLSP